MNRSPGLLLAVVLIAAACFRFAVIDRAFEYDPEGSSCLYGVLARNYLRFDWAQTHGMPVLTIGQAVDAPVIFYRDHPPMVPLLIVPFYAAFGVGEWQTRLPISLVTIAAIYVLYRLTAHAATARAGVVAAAVFAAAPMTLYFGGFPDVIGMPLILFVLLSVMAYMRFHRAPSGATLAALVAAFALAGICDWPAYIIVPVFLTHFAATRPLREWPRIIAFCVAACALFAAVYVYIALATNAPWDWIVPLFSRRSAMVGGSRFTLAQWFGAAFAFNRTYHTLPLLIASALWIGISGFRFRAPDPGATVARLLLAWGGLYVLIGSKAVYDHEWVWSLLTPGMAVSAALLIESMIATAEARGSGAPARAVAAVGLAAFACWTGYGTFRMLYPTRPNSLGDPIVLGRAIQAAAPGANDVALLVTGEEAEPQLWFYGDRPLRTRAWSIPDFEQRVDGGTVDVMYDFEIQPWKARATGIVMPRGWDNGGGELRRYLTQRYPVTTLPDDVAQRFDVFDLRVR